VALQGKNYDFSLPEEEAPTVEAVWDATCRAASAEITDGAEDQGLDWYREHGFRLAPFPRIKWYLYAAIEDAGLRFELPYQERLMRVGKQLGRRLHEQGISWWDEQLEEYDPLPEYKNYPQLWERALERNFNVDIRDYPFWAVTARSMQYAWGGNAGIQIMREAAQNVGGHGGVVINSGRAAELGLADGDLVEIRSPLNVTRGRVETRQGIRPDTVLMIGQFEHWATPYAKDLELPSLNKLVPMLLDLTDSTGSGADLARVSITRVGGQR
jgi:phenylacetyl-CoA:acceptor oxidoreductase